VIEPVIMGDAVVPRRLQKARLGDLSHLLPEIRQRRLGSFAASERETVRQHDCVHRPGACCAHSIDLKAGLLEQALQNAPGESAMRASTLEREIDGLGLAIGADAGLELCKSCATRNRASMHATRDIHDVLPWPVAQPLIRRHSLNRFNRMGTFAFATL